MIENVAAEANQDEWDDDMAVTVNSFCYEGQISQEVASQTPNCQEHEEHAQDHQQWPELGRRKQWRVDADIVSAITKCDRGNCEDGRAKLNGLTTFLTSGFP